MEVTKKPRCLDEESTEDKALRSFLAELPNGYDAEIGQVVAVELSRASSGTQVLVRTDSHHRPNEDPERHLIRSQAASALQSAIGALRPRERAVIFGLVEGKTYAAIGRTMGGVCRETVMQATVQACYSIRKTLLRGAFGERVWSPLSEKSYFVRLEAVSKQLKSELFAQW